MDKLLEHNQKAIEHLAVIRTAMETISSEIAKIREILEETEVKKD